MLLNCSWSQCRGWGRQALKSLRHKSKMGNFVVQWLTHVRLFATPWAATRQTSLSFTISQSLLKFMSIELGMLSNPLILSRPLLLWPFIFPSTRVFPSESALHIRWPKCWIFSFSINSSNEYSGLISFRTDWFDLPGSPMEPWTLSLEPSPATKFKSINSFITEVTTMRILSTSVRVAPTCQN